MIVENTHVITIPKILFNLIFFNKCDFWQCYVKKIVKKRVSNYKKIEMRIKIYLRVSVSSYKKSIISETKNRNKTF